MRCPPAPTGDRAVWYPTAMNANATSGKENTDTLDQHDVRALTEYMSVLGCIGFTKDVGGLDIVVSQSGKERPDDCDCSASQLGI